MSLVCFLSFFSVLSSAAATSPPSITESDTTDFETVSGDTVVAKLYICTQRVGLGHSWIYIESLFGGEMAVGCFTLRPYAAVSVGTFGVTRADGAGLYYNVEAYCAAEYGLKNQAWIGKEITKDQLVSVSKKIKSWNRWDLFFNCSYFAADIWNTVSSDKIYAFVFPAFERFQILSKGGNADVTMKSTSKSECFKQSGNGDKAEIKQVRDKTLSSKLL